MHDARPLIERGDEAVRRLARRGYALDLAGLEELSARRNSSIARTDDLRAESKRVAQEVGRVAKETRGQGPEVEKLKTRARELKDEIREAEESVTAAEAALREVLLAIPKLPAGDTPHAAP